MTAIVGIKEVSIWITEVDSDKPIAEIRIGETITKQQEQTELEYLLKFPFSAFLISFNLTETSTVVKQRLRQLGNSLDPQVISAVESLIDGAIANFKSL